MPFSGTTTLIAGAPALVLGLLVGLLGSFSDDLGAGTVVQVVLWVLSGALLLAAGISLATGAAGAGAPRQPSQRTRRRRPAASRPS